MFKRSLSLAALMAMVPVAALAGPVSSRVMTTGGTISVNGGAAQSSAAGTVRNSFSTSVPVVMTPAAGYAVSSVKLNSVDKGALSSISVPLSSSLQTVAVSFVKKNITVTSSAASIDGTVSPYGARTTPANTVITYTFIPHTGKSVQSIVGLPAGAVLKNSANQVVTLPYPGAVKATFTTPDTPLTIVAHFVGLSASAGATQTVLVGGQATLAGSATVTTGTTYAWSQVAGPAAATILNATSATPKVTVPSAGTYTFQVTATNGSATATATTRVVATSSITKAAQDQCVTCHNSAKVGTNVYSQWSASVHSEQAGSLCSSCHTGAGSGSHPGSAKACGDCHSAEGSDFYASPHWNNSIYTPEPQAWNRTGEDAALPATYSSQVSDIKVALEDQNLGNCMNRCHFRPGQGGISIADNFGPGGVGTTVKPNGTPAQYAAGTVQTKGTVPVGKVACAACHSTGGQHGDGTKGTLAAGNLGPAKGGPGLYNDATYFGGKGPNGTDAVVVAIPGVVMSNISTSGDLKHTVRRVNMYQTCLMCHFGKNHGNPAYSYLKSEHYANPYWQYGDKQVQCQDCHNAHSTESAFPQYDATYTKTADGACDQCHTGQYSIFNADNTIKAPHVAGGKLAKGGAAINVGSSTPGWYSGTRNVFLNATSQYITPNNGCNACHGHNNSVNGEYAKTMHADPYGRTKSAQGFKFKGYSSATATEYTPDKVSTDGCVRCHTTTGFVNFIESDYKDLRAWGFKDTADKTGEVIGCRACHRTTRYEEDHPEAEAPDAFTQPGMFVTLPEGTYNWQNDYSFTLATDQGVRNPVAIRGWVPARADQKAQVPQSAYKGFYNYSVANVKKFVTGVQFADYKMSNVCVSCHAGRNGATNGDAIKSLAGFSSFTSLGIIGGKLPSLPHGVYQSAILNGSIGYQYSAFSAGATSHANIGTGVTGTNYGVNFNGVNTPGPCVSCHMSYKVVTGKPDGVNSVSTQHRKHDFAVKGTDVYTQLCNKCHTGLNDAALDASKAQFQAAVSALAEIMKTGSNKFGAATVTTIVANSYGAYDVNVADSHMGAGSSFNADLAGAGFNLKLLYNVAYGSSDLGAYAHNPAYLKQLLKDTINAMRDSNATTSAADAASKLGGLTSQQKADAMLYLQ